MKKLAILLFTICVGLGSALAQHGWTRVNYPSSTIFTGIVTINGATIDAGAGYVGVFVGDECRMISEVKVTQIDGADVSYVSAVVHCSDSLKVPEEVKIKFYETSTGKTYDIDTAFEAAVHGDVRLFPIDVLKEGEETDAPKIEITKAFINAFPIPFDNELTIETDKKIKEVSLVDNVGKTVISQKNVESKEITLETASLAEGLYYVSIVYENGESGTKRVVKD